MKILFCGKFIAMKKLTFIISSLIITLITSSCQPEEIEDPNDPNNSNGTTSTFTDPRDGQVYNIVTIGTQTWFAENLRYAGSIPQVIGNLNWASQTQPAWCYYDDSPSIGATYGKMYNWYAVNTGSLCPSGWHIPTDAEWTVLTDYLGGLNIAGAAMKTTTGWDNNTGATNSSGFSGLPGGSRKQDLGNQNSGESASLGIVANFWSSSEEIISSLPYGVQRHLSSGINEANRFTVPKETGHSCRCLQD